MKEYEKNCFERGHAESCAVTLYERGCALGDGIITCVDGAALVSEGKLVPRNFTAARQMWERGCTARSGKSCRALADRLRAGKDGFEKDPRAALVLYVEGCSYELDICEQLGDAYAAGVGLAAPDPAKAKERYEYACEWGVSTACKKVKK